MDSRKLCSPDQPLEKIFIAFQDQHHIKEAANFWARREFIIEWGQRLSARECRSWRHFKELLLVSFQHFPHKMFTNCVASGGSRERWKPGRAEGGWSIIARAEWIPRKAIFLLEPVLWYDSPSQLLLTDAWPQTTHLALKRVQYEHFLEL